MDADRIVTDERLEPVQSPVVRKKLSHPGKEERRGVNPGRASAAFLGVLRMRGTVAPQHEFRVRSESSGEQGIAVFRALGDGLAEEVRLEQAARDIIQSDDQVMAGDGGVEIFIAI